MTSTRIAAGCATLLGLATLSYADVTINVAFGTGAVTPTGAAFYGNPGDMWNEVNASSGGFIGPVSLIDSTGASTTANLTLLSDGAAAAINPPSQPNPDLTHYYAFNNSGGPIVAQLTGLTPGGEYNLALYVSSDDAAGGDWSVAGTVFGGTTMNFAADGDPKSMFVDGGNMITMDVTANSKGELGIVEFGGMGNSSGEVALNGLQLQSEAVPEPASLGVLAMGVIALLSRRRKSS